MLAAMRARRTITVVGCHAGGEIGNVVTGGVLPPAGATVFEQMQTLRRDGDWLRRLLLREPRGSVACHANLVVPRDPAGLRRRLHHHGADRVPGDVGLEHDLHGHRAARDRHGRDARAGDGAAAGGAGRGGRGARRLPRRPLRERRADQRRRRSPTGSTRRSRSRASARSRVDVAYGGMWYAIADAAGAGVRDRARRGPRPVAGRRADPRGGARAAARASTPRTRRSPASASSSSPGRGRASGRSAATRSSSRPGRLDRSATGTGPVGADGRAARPRADGAWATR